MSVSIDQYNALQNQMAQMMAMFQNLSASGSLPAASGKPVKAKKERKPRSADAKPNPWIAFTTEVRSVLEGAGHKLGKECTQFCSYLKEQDPVYSNWGSDAILENFSGWTAPEVSKQKAAGKSSRKSKSSDAGSVAGSDAVSAATAPSETKKRKSRFDSMSPEEAAAEKAKIAARLKAGREAKKAGAAASVDAPVAAPVSVPAPVAAPVASSAPAATSAVVWKPILLGGKRYLYNPANFQCYHREGDGSQGAWAGILNVASKSIDTSVPEPVEEEEELDFDA